MNNKGYIQILMLPILALSLLFGGSAVNAATGWFSGLFVGLAMLAMTIVLLYFGTMVVAAGSSVAQFIGIVLLAFGLLTGMMFFYTVSPDSFKGIGFSMAGHETSAAALTIPFLSVEQVPIQDSIIGNMPESLTIALIIAGALAFYLVVNFAYRGKKK